MLSNTKLVLQFLFGFSVTSISSVRIRVLDVPQAAKAGLDVKLTCDFDLQGQRLYQVKWYKGTHEFYRYSPNDENRIKLFLVENLDVDPRRSDSMTVVLKNLHVDMTGTYTCEVSTEGTFETVQASAKMDVILIPKGGPHIQGYRRIAEIGESITLNCTSLKSKPAAQLTFYINNKKVKGRRAHVNLRKYIITNDKDRPKTETSILSMEFRIKKHHVIDSRILISCEANIMKIYSRTRTETVLVKNPPTKPPASSDRISSTGATCFKTKFMILLQLYVIVELFL